MPDIFCAHREWSLKLYKKLQNKKKNLVLIKSPKKLTLKIVEKHNPKYIFFPDWSWIVPEEIIKRRKCVCFHESDLPKFRGGSPIQNQIIRKIKQTKTTAFLMNEKIDEGDIILKKKLSLEGNLNEIFDRMIQNDYEMILKIIKGNYKIKKQIGNLSYYKRRKPSQSELNNLNHSNEYLYNFIRMLSDPYPNAFLKVGKKKILFNTGF